ncbi:family 16 glycosylhydrolase [Flavobacterium sp.]|uniref:family 16 glycosylhydrolase n=1 Tax=Flavobacterium sp. TaxID=239 RepID=UPI002FDCB6A7
MNIITGNRNFLFLKYRLKKLLRFLINQEKLNTFGDGENQINKVFIINLDRQKERWRLIQEELTRIKIPNKNTLLSFTERFSAIDAKNQSIKTNKINSSYTLEDQYFVDPNPELLNIIREKEIIIDLTKQEIAVALSHLSIWDKIIDENIHSGLILEDDIYFENKFSNKLNSLWKEIVESKIEFDIIYLSYKKVEHAPDLTRISNNLSIPNRGIWWLSGYILSNKGARKLQEKLPITGPVDLWINHKFNELDVYTCNDSIISQKLFITSDNNYSILPILSQIGIKSNKTFIDLDKLKGRNPVFMFDLSSNKSNLLKLEILLSLNSYRTHFMKSDRELDHIKNLINRKETLLFDAYIGFNSLIEMIPSLISFYPNVIIIILSKDNDSIPQACSSYIGKNIFCVNPKRNITKEVSKLLKIKNWDLDSDDILKINPEINEKVIQISIPNDYKYLEHDVTPWILPIENIKKYLPYDFNKNEIIPIAKHVENRIDYFEEFDVNFWGILEDTFPSNQSRFSKENFSLSSELDSGFQLEITNSVQGEKKYSSSSIVSIEKFIHGSFEISMKPIKGEGIVSAFFLHRNDPWQEIDIEFLGHDTTKILLNVYYNPGIVNTKYNFGLRGTPVLIDLGFDASEDFHDYRIEWEYHEIRWYVDNEIIHVRKAWMPTPIPNLPMVVYVNAWITNSEELAGKFEESLLPKTSFIRYIKMYNFDYTKN